MATTISANPAKLKTTVLGNNISQTPKTPEAISSACLEAALGCTLLTKLATKHGQELSRILPSAVLHLIADIRCNRVRVTKANGNDLIVRDIDTAADKIKVSLILVSGSVAMLLKLERENPAQLSTILDSACQKMNGPNEPKLLKLGKSIHIQSDAISFDKHSADLVLKGDVFFFT